MGQRAESQTSGGSFAPVGELSERLYAPQPEEAERMLASGAMTEDEEEMPERAEGEPLLWQLHNRYVLTQIRSGLMILDQHAAHERILYERARESMKNGFGLSQQLLFPYTLDFSPGDFALLEELVPDLISLGFDLKLFSGRSAVVHGVPTDIRPGDERRILDDILQQYKSYQSDLHIKGRDNLAKSIAHRSAVRAGSKMSAKEMRKLIDELFMCEMPYASPHGRPTMIKISIEELDKRFGAK
jgi:DNA mismatch repair protein MutL